MKILISNDDGVNAPGLWKAVEAVRELGEVTVVAPDRERSGVGPSVTLHNPIRFREVISRVEGVKSYAVEGTPADAIILAMEVVIKDKVDLLISGINQGANLGDDILVSGTMGAALQGFFMGLPAIAVSLASLSSTDFQAATIITCLLAKSVAEGALPKSILLNVNLPPVPPEQIRGVEITRMGRRGYMDSVREGNDGRHNYYWIARSRPVRDMLEGTDIWAVRNTFISITPIQTDMTAMAQLDEITGLKNDFSVHFGTKLQENR